MWKAIKMLSPLLLMIVGGIGSMAVYYLREMSRSMKVVGESLVRIETQIQHHEERLDRLEDHCPLLKKTTP
jgi:hypothetical protein